MSSDALFLRDPLTGIELRFASVVSYTTTRNNRVSQHPVEQGVDISDHVQELPMILSAEIQITESPWSNGDAANLSGPALITRILSVLQSMQRKRLQVVTHRLGVLPDMVITKLPTPIDKIRMVKITMELQQVRIATATLVDVPASSVVTSDPGSTATTADQSLAEQVAQDAQAAASGLPSEVDAGQQPTTDMGATTTSATTTATVESDTSAAYDMASWLGVV